MQIMYGNAHDSWCIIFQNLFICSSLHASFFDFASCLFAKIVSSAVQITKKVNRKVQEEPQAEAAANPRHQEEEKRWHRLMCA